MLLGRTTFALVFALVGVGVAAVPVCADEPAPEARAAELETELPKPRRGYTLAQCAAFAERNYPKVAESRAKAAYYRAQLDEARSAPFSQWTFTSGVALAPTVRGNSIYSPDTDVAISSNMGLAWQVNIDGVVPLWTFGKITSLASAAEHQVELGEHQIKKEQNQVKLDVRRAYFGLQLARSSRALLAEAAKRLDDAIVKLARSVEDGEGDEIDLFKLQTHRAELDAREAEAERYERIALAGLQFLTGINRGFDVASDTLTEPKHHLGPVTRYLEAARLYRPEINMARAGLRAREAQVALARAKLYPDIGIGMGAGWTRAPEVTDQRNPFVRDDANYVRFGLGLVMRWNLDLLPAYARLEQARAQLEETRAIERTALGGVGVEIETAYAEVLAARKREQAYGRAETVAKKWLIAIQQGIDIGTQEEKDLVDPAKAYAEQRFNHMNALMDLNVALSKLALVTGWDAIAPEG